MTFNSRLTGNVVLQCVISIFLIDLMGPKYKQSVRDAGYPIWACNYTDFTFFVLDGGYNCNG